jgi:hypothetical protein
MLSKMRVQKYCTYYAHSLACALTKIIIEIMGDKNSESEKCSERSPTYGFLIICGSSERDGRNYCSG